MLENNTLYLKKKKPNNIYVNTGLIYRSECVAFYRLNLFFFQHNLERVLLTVELHWLNVLKLKNLGTSLF